MGRDRVPAVDTEIERLYQLPLAEFTAARNLLAKGAGAKGAPIRALEKPSLAAWAVNQLFWKRRASWDRLVGAADLARVAHRKRVAGKGGDVETAERDHRDAVRAAADDIRNLLREAGEAATAATMSAVIETLQALPGSETPGRLTRPLKPMGLEALAGLVRSSGAFPRAIPPQAARDEAAARAKASRDATASRRDAQAERREAEARKRESAARKREAAGIERELREAREAERKAEADVLRGRRVLEHTERERHRAAERLQFLDKQRTTAADELRRQEVRMTETAGARMALEAKLRALAAGGG